MNRNRKTFVRINNFLNTGEKFMPLESRLQPVAGLNYRLKPRLQLFNIILTPTKIRGTSCLMWLRRFKDN